MCFLWGDLERLKNNHCHNNSYLFRIPVSLSFLQNILAWYNIYDGDYFCKANERLPFHSLLASVIDTEHSLSLFFLLWLCWVFIASQSCLVAEGGVCRLAAVCRRLTAVTSLAAEHKLEGTQTSVAAASGLESIGSVVMAHELGCFTACGIFPDQRSNLCLLHWQVDSSLLSHQGSHHLSHLLLLL